MPTKYPVQTSTVDGATISEGLIPTAIPVPIAEGGTNATTEANARTALGVPPLSHDHSDAANGDNIPAASVTGTAVVQARTINTTGPVTGGGDLSADRTIAVDNSTSTNAGIGDAGKLLKLDAAGKAAGRELETDGTKLDGIEAAADVTDSANVRTSLAAPDKNATVQTTEDPATVLKTIAVATSKTILIEARVAALKSGAAQGAGYILRAAFRNAAGTVSQIGGDSVDTVFEDDATWGGVSTAISGTNAQVKVTGKLATTIDWGGDFYVTTM